MTMAVCMVICSTEGGRDSCHVIAASPSEAWEALPAARNRDARWFSHCDSERAGDVILQAMETMAKHADENG